MARPYKKQNKEYWNNISKKNVQQAIAEPFPDLNIQGDGLEPFSSIAALGGGTLSKASYRDGYAPTVTPSDSYKNIDSGLLPWEANSGKVGISKAILLCQKAAANIAIVRNTIETCCEFSNSPIHIKSSNTTVKSFFEAWFERINLYKLVDNFMREYYRSGNVFMYKFIGKMNKEQYKKMNDAFGAKKEVLPIRYIILNPAQIYLEGGMSYNSSNWVKILSTYEIERLKDPKTEEDKQIFNSLPDDVKNQIKNGVGSGGVYIPLDTSRLYYVFYKKQDYEPMAVPMIYPVLNDIEHKLELKKMDMSLSRTIEHVILLVTTGQKNDEHNKNGINPQNLAALQTIFKNQTLGRVLVADYTTKAEWLIPEIDKIIGPQKYQQVEKDIQEGLQSIFGSTDEKFANAQIKAKIFLERMKEAQKSFLNNFLIPEIKIICEAMNFKNIPKVEFETLSLDDPAVMARIYTQLLQLGVLTPPEVMMALQSGILPDKESNIINQKEYKKQRDDGLYFPLVGGSKEEEAQTTPTGRPTGINTKVSTKKVGPIGKSKGSEEVKFSVKKLTELTIKAFELKENICSSLKKKYKVKENLDDSQKYVADLIAKAVISNESPENWTDKIVKSYIENPKEIKEDVAKEIDDISFIYDTSQWDAALLRNCKL